MNFSKEMDFERDGGYNSDYLSVILQQLNNTGYHNYTHDLVKFHEWMQHRSRPMDVWEYLEATNGPRRGPLWAVITVTCIYGFIFLSGIFGNVCTCIVIMKNKYMHTATNYYLFNLAIADLLLLLSGLPPETYSIWYLYPWIFGEAVCVGRTLFAEMCTNASIFTITAFTIER